MKNSSTKKNRQLRKKHVIFTWQTFLYIAWGKALFAF
jgi:hypothetical protein